MFMREYHTDWLIWLALHWRAVALPHSHPLPLSHTHTHTHTRAHTHTHARKTFKVQDKDARLDSNVVAPSSTHPLQYINNKHD